MGQYYRTLLKEGNGKLTVYNRKIIIDGQEEYMMAKLTEHSWWYNPFVNAVCQRIYESTKRSRIIWIGDYADQFADNLDEPHNGLTQKKIRHYHKRCWGEPDTAIAIPTTEFTLDGKFIVNHSKREYITCSDYYKECVVGDGWCLHPLPLLTCIGNGLGGGDYTRPTIGSSADIVGMWAWDEISIEDQSPAEEENYAEIFPIFKEEGWD